MFTRPGPPGVDERPGTIVAASVEVACQEARQIAVTGGTAEVYYVSDTGERETLERFEALPAAQPAPRPWTDGRTLSRAVQRPAM